MFCTRCGKQIEDGSRFCPYCGMMQKTDEKGLQEQKISDVGQEKIISHTQNVSDQPVVHKTSRSFGKAIENFIIKFLTADWEDKVYLILAVIFSVRIAVFLIPEIFVYPETIRWMNISGIIASCLVYYGTAALLVDTAVYWIWSIRTMELSAGGKIRIDSVLLGIWMIVIKLFFSKMSGLYNGKMTIGIYVAARSYLSVAVFIIIILIACGAIRIIKMQRNSLVL